MVKDLALLSALDELTDTPVKEYLDTLLAEALDNLIRENDKEEIFRIQGGLRILKRVLRDIETAEDEKMRLRERENRPDSKHLF